MIKKMNDLGFGVHSLDDLKRHLLVAIEIEHATIPPYLCALFSLEGGSNSTPAYVLRSVVIEEMLHMTLATNVLNAIGGKPHFDHKHFVNRYPLELPHSKEPIVLRLLPFNREFLKTAMDLERPELYGAQPQPDHYDTIAQFYQAIEEGLTKICPNDSDYAHHPERQVTAEYYYGAGGGAFAITNLATALSALKVICDQGEGARGGIKDGDPGEFGGPEFAHFYRFNELLLERFYAPTDSPARPPTGDPLPIDWAAILPMGPDPSADKFDPGSEIRRKMDEFNRAYTGFLQLLQTGFTGQPAVFRQAVGQMYQLKDLTLELMRIPVGNGQTAGPSFEHLSAEGAQA